MPSSVDVQMQRGSPRVTQLAKGKHVLAGALILLALSVVSAVVSFMPVAQSQTQDRVIIDSIFVLTPHETYRQGLGAFHGDETIRLRIKASGNSSVNFTLLTYGGTQYSNSSESEIDYSFLAGADYYEAVFLADSTTSEVRFQVHVQAQNVSYPFAWLLPSAKAVFLLSWSSIIIMLLLMRNGTVWLSNTTEQKESSAPILNRKNLRMLKMLLVGSLVFWFVLLAVNSYPLGTFENWYTDAARDSYSANLFLKVGFPIFSTPLGSLSSADSSFFKFVTWPEMPHLYPLGSLFLFLPFSFLLENNVASILVFKLEIDLFLTISHSCMYFFLKRFLKQELSFVLKALAIYILYIVLVVYSADGMFDTVAFAFSLVAMIMFLEHRYDVFLLFVAVSATFKYQAGIFMIPLIFVGLLKLLQQQNPQGLLNNKFLWGALGLVVIDLTTAYFSAPYLMVTRPEFVMNGVNAFNPHAQIPWSLQVFAVLLTMSVTIACAVYLFKRNRLLSLFAIFSLLPAYLMPYFQAWYLPFFFVYALVPSQKRALEVAMVWMIFMIIVLSFGGLAYNPVQILDNVRKVLNL